MKIDAVFSGGGVKAFAFLGALEVFEKKNYQIERVAGTSAGAILASFLAAGYTTKEIRDIFYNLDLRIFLDPPFYAKKYSPLQLLSLYFNKGLYKGERLECWLEEKLRAKGIVTFRDLKHRELKVVASDVTKGRMVVIPDDLERLYQVPPEHFKVAKAIRMSAGFPYFFMPTKLKNKERKISYLVDGGLLSNFPLWLFNKPHRTTRPVIGITLSESLSQEKEEHIRNGVDLLQAIFKTMLKAQDTRYISKDKSKNIVFIPVKDVRTVDFNLDDDEKNRLIQLGRERTEAFLKTWIF